MDPKDLDQEMNALIEKMGRKTPVNSDPYSGDPLSSDHFILARSWDFFKKRVAAIEKQWQEITNAKIEEIRVLKKETDQLRDRINELESDRINLEAMIANFRTVRLEDYEKMKRQNEKMKMAWEEERVSLETRRISLEQDIEQKKREIEEKDLDSKSRLAQLDKTCEDLKREKEDTLQSAVKFQQEIQKQLGEKDEDFKSADLKIELLKREVDRRDQIMGEMKIEMVQAREKEKESAEEISRFQALVKNKEEEILGLKNQLDFMRREKETLLQDWQREKAEWRELWDRAREVWKKKND